MIKINIWIAFTFFCFILCPIINFAQIETQSSGTSKSRLVAQIPFELVNGSIILTLKINKCERPLKMLFDTGANGMAMSQSLADSIGLQSSFTKDASVVGGTAKIEISRGNTVHLDTMTLFNQSIAIFKTVKKGTDGIIGHSIVKKYITHVDFDKKLLSLYTFGNFKPHKKGTVVPLTYRSSALLVQGNLSITKEKPVSGFFVFDTGASYQLICFRPFVIKNRLLTNGFVPQSQGSTVSMGVATTTFSGSAYSFSLNGMDDVMNMNVELMAGGNTDAASGNVPDGSLGIRFISKYNFTIDISRNAVILYSRS